MIVKRNRNKEIIFKFFELFNLGIFKLLPRTSTKEIKKLFRNKELIGVEIGVYEGKNAENLLKNLNIKKLYLIDSYEAYTDDGYDGSKSIHSQKELDKVKGDAIKRLSNYEDKIEFKFNKSNENLDAIPNNLDFVYIDGGHNYEIIKQDIDNYYKKLKVGGVLAGHDVWLRDTWKGIWEFAVKNKLILNTEINDWFIIKKQKKKKIHGK